MHATVRTQEKLKRRKLKPYPQPSRSETLANQEREETGGEGNSGNMEGWFEGHKQQ